MALFFFNKLITNIFTSDSVGTLSTLTNFKLAEKREEPGYEKRTRYKPWKYRA